jgi:hypothetical protein
MSDTNGVAELRKLNAIQLTALGFQERQATILKDALRFTSAQTVPQEDKPLRRIWKPLVPITVDGKTRFRAIKKRCPCHGRLMLERWSDTAKAWFEMCTIIAWFEIVREHNLSGRREVIPVEPEALWLYWREREKV